MVPATLGIRSPDGDGDDGTVDGGRCGRLGETFAWAGPPSLVAGRVRVRTQ